MKNKALFHGIIIYEIIDNGHPLILNGIYSTSDDYLISNEIAKRKITSKDEPDILGDYDSRYIETIGEPKKVIECDLRITKNHEAYEFKWTNSNGLDQKGIGIKINSKQIAVSYINV